MRKLFKVMSIASLAILTGLAISACGSKKTTTKDVTTKNSTTKVAPTTKKATTTVNPTTKETTPTEDGYSIVSEGSIAGATVNLSTLEMVDGTPKSVPIDTSKKYKEGTILFAQVINDSAKNVKISALVGGKIADRAYIAAGDAGGLFGVELTGNMTFKLEDSTEIETSTLSIDLDSTKDTDTRVNSLHVYSENFVDMPDFADETTLEVGEKIKIFVWNCASDVTLTITNGEDPEDTIEREYKILSEDEQGPDGKGHDEIFEITVKGDVTVTVTALGGKVNYDFSTFTDINANVYYYDGNDEKVAVNSGNEIPYGIDVHVDATNSSTTKKYILVAKDGDGDTIISCPIENAEDYEYGIIFTVENNKTIISIEEYVECSITLTGNADVDLTGTYVSDSGFVEIGNGTTTLAKYTKIVVSATNKNETLNYIIRATYGEYSVSKLLEANGTYSFEELPLEGDVTFEIIAYSEHTVTITNEYASDVRLMAFYMDIDAEMPAMVNSGDKVMDGIVVMVSAATMGEGKYAITINNGSEVVCAEAVSSMDDYAAPYTFNAKGDITITIETLE